MNSNSVSSEQAFFIVGVATCTTNKAAVEDAVIQILWGQFFTDQVLLKVENRIDNAIIALYYDFESDKDGKYTVLIGVRVSSLDDVPEGLTAQSVPAEKRTVFMSEQGPIGTIVFDTWKKIWDLEASNKLDRLYGYDYELYDERSNNPVYAQVGVHIGIK